MAAPLEIKQIIRFLRDNYVYLVDITGGPGQPRSM